MKTMMNIVLATLMLSSSAFASDITCNVASEVPSKPQSSYKLIVPIDSNPQDCEKSKSYVIPGTTLNITVHGHGGCNPAPEFCPDVGSSIDGIESHDTASRNYSKTYGGCLKRFEEMYLQTTFQGSMRVNVVVACTLNP